jgi:hypothetical protein
MADELSRVQAYVQRLAGRERQLLVTSLVFRALIGVALALVLAAVAAQRNADPATWAAGIVLVLGLGGFAFIGWPLVRRWRATADLRRQARLVEAQAPDLRGRLVTAVERPEGPVGSESPMLVALMAKRAWVHCERVAPPTVHPATNTLRHGLGAAASWVVALLVVLFAPGGGQGIATWWLGGPVAEAAASIDEVSEALPSARVGDLTLRYVYPAYTGLEPYEVVNSTGEAHAPPGTRVEVIARSADPVESAAVVAYDDPALDASVTDGRVISGSFVVRNMEGDYRIVTHANGEAAASEAFPIVPEPDLPPEVSVSAADIVGDTIEIPINGRISLDWLAKDDYGVDRVVLEIDGKERSPELYRVRERRAEVGKRLDMRPIDMGMKSGTTYELVVAAYDNDTVTGSKAGRSQVLEIVVLGPEGGRDLSPEALDELLELMLDALADHLEEPHPPGRLSGDFARWGELVNTRWEPIVSAIEDNLGSKALAHIRWFPLAQAVDKGRSLVRFTQVSFVPGSRERANQQSVDIVADLRTEAIASLEAAILHLDALRSKAALREVASSTRDLVEEADAIRKEFRREDVDPQNLAMSADVLSDYLRHLQEQGERLAEGGLKDLVEARTSEAEAMLQELRSDLAAGDTESAKQMMERLARQLDDLASDIRNDLERRREQAQQQGEQGDALIEELERIAAEQAELSKQVQEIQEAASAPQREKIRDLWKEVASAVDDVEANLAGFASDLERAEREFNEREYVRSAREDADSLQASVAVRDVAEATDDAIALQQRWTDYRRRMDLFLRRGSPGGPGPTQYNKIRQDIEQVTELLEQLRRVDASGSQASRQQLQELRQQQQQLESDLATASEDAEEFIQQMWVQPQGMMESLESGESRMDQAGAELQQAQAMQAQGSQDAAERHVRDAIEALQQAMQQQASQGGGEGEGGGGEPTEGEPNGPGDEEDGENMRPIDLELPEPEEFRTPEEYRRALLDGMAGDVPAEFRALKKRYYEELVHQ